MADAHRRRRSLRLSVLALPLLLLALAGVQSARAASRAQDDKTALQGPGQRGVRLRRTQQHLAVAQAAFVDVRRDLRLAGPVVWVGSVTVP